MESNQYQQIRALASIIKRFSDIQVEDPRFYQRFLPLLEQKHQQDYMHMLMYLLQHVKDGKEIARMFESWYNTQDTETPPPVLNPKTKKQPVTNAPINADTGKVVPQKEQQIEEEEQKQETSKPNDNKKEPAVELFFPVAVSEQSYQSTQLNQYLHENYLQENLSSIICNGLIATGLRFHEKAQQIEGVARQSGLYEILFILYRNTPQDRKVDIDANLLIVPAQITFDEVLTQGMPFELPIPLQNYGLSGLFQTCHLEGMLANEYEIHAQGQVLKGYPQTAGRISLMLHFTWEGGVGKIPLWWEVR